MPRGERSRWPDGDHRPGGRLGEGSASALRRVVGRAGRAGRRAGSAPGGADARGGENGDQEEGERSETCQGEPLHLAGAALEEPLHTGEELAGALGHAPPGARWASHALEPGGDRGQPLGDREPRAVAGGRPVVAEVLGHLLHASAGHAVQRLEEEQLLQHRPEDQPQRVEAPEVGQLMGEDASLLGAIELEERLGGETDLPQPRATGLRRPAEVVSRTSRVWCTSWHRPRRRARTIGSTTGVRSPSALRTRARSNARRRSRALATTAQPMKASEAGRRLAGGVETQCGAGTTGAPLGVCADATAVGSAGSVDRGTSTTIRFSRGR